MLDQLEIFLVRLKISYEAFVIWNQLPLVEQSLINESEILHKDVVEFWIKAYHPYLPLYFEAVVG